MTRKRWVALLVGMLLLGAVVTVAVQWRLPRRSEIGQKPGKPAHRAQVRGNSLEVQLHFPPSRRATVERQVDPVLLERQLPEPILWDGLDPPCRRLLLMRQRTWEAPFDASGESGLDADWEWAR